MRIADRKYFIPPLFVRSNANEKNPKKVIVDRLKRSVLNRKSSVIVVVTPIKLIRVVLRIIFHAGVRLYTRS